MQYWNHPLGQSLTADGFVFQQLLEECSIGTQSCQLYSGCRLVSVVVRRMQYWNVDCQGLIPLPDKFQQLLEECSIGTHRPRRNCRGFCVSVVVRRMQYWNFRIGNLSREIPPFQQLLEECSIGTCLIQFLPVIRQSFSSCQKNVVLEQYSHILHKPYNEFQQLLEECSIGTLRPSPETSH